MVDELLAYFRSRGRDLVWRRTHDPYKILLSEVMLQQTRIAAVIPYFERFTAEVPDVEHLAALSEERLLKLWEGLGYYSRARNLRKAAQKIVSLGHFPDTYEEILALPGVGEYTAGAVASIAFGLPTPAVDGNVLRVLSRLQNQELDRKTARQYLQTLYPAGHCGEFTQALMELGEMICLPRTKPRCAECPLQKECLALRCNRVAELPRPKRKKSRRVEKKTVLLAEWDDRIALCKRPDCGLLAGMWALPDTGGVPLTVYLRRHPLAVRTARELGQTRHVFTHVEWEMQAIRLRLDSPPDDLPWTFVPPEKLRTSYALPTAFRKVLALAEKAGRVEKSPQSRRKSASRSAEKSL